MSLTQTVSRYHNDLARLMQPLRGQELTTAEIKSLLEPHFGADTQWILPSDHCQNHTCEGACECATTDNAVFDQIERGRYRVR